MKTTELTKKKKITVRKLTFRFVPELCQVTLAKISSVENNTEAPQKDECFGRTLMNHDP